MQLTDIHHGAWVSLKAVRRMVQVVNALQPDLIVLTGDYVTGSSRYIAPVILTLGRLQARIGVLGVLGNHDWWEGEAATRSCCTKAGIALVDNARLFLTPQRKLVGELPRQGQGLCIAGVGDYWEDEVDARKALDGVPPEMPRLLLSHNPDAAEMGILRNFRVDLMLAGHTHGGQIWVPGLGTPGVPSEHGQKYASGLVQGPWCPVYVSRGLGMAVLPVRFGVPPEIVAFEFVGRA